MSRKTLACIAVAIAALPIAGIASAGVISQVATFSAPQDAVVDGAGNL